ncbi:transcriptional regulator, partial [Phycicoccus flavus]|uniref:transcriptional regulator n=1 Tax=Phycicoccus flavus TaxID=2502783 RepID=UPI000FEBE37D
MPHPVFDEVIHEPHRLRICAFLVPVGGREFAEVRDELGLSDSALSKHLKALTAKGYTRLERGVRDGRQLTTVALTAAGREALCG